LRSSGFGRQPRCSGPPAKAIGCKSRLYCVPPRACAHTSGSSGKASGPCGHLAAAAASCCLPGHCPELPALPAAAEGCAVGTAGGVCCAASAALGRAARPAHDVGLLLQSPACYWVSRRATLLVCCVWQHGCAMGLAGLQAPLRSAAHCMAEPRGPGGHLRSLVCHLHAAAVVPPSYMLHCYQSTVWPC